MKKAIFMAIASIGLCLTSFAQEETRVSFFHKAFLSQVGNMPNTVLFTPSRDEDCHISMYVENISLDSNGVSAYLLYSDASGQNLYTSILKSTNPSAAPQVFAIHASANTPVIVNGQINGLNASQSYSLYVTSVCQ